MNSLTKATQILIKHYNLWIENVSSEILKYNTHKIRHSNWVLEVWRNLIIKLKEKQKISEETINRSEIIFLLHDLGRFYQNNKEYVFKNNEYEHWDESAKIVIEEWYDDKIYLAIKYHNKYSIENLYKEEKFLSMSNKDQKEAIFLSKIVRDADKLQNMIYTIFNIYHFLKIDIYWQWLKREDISEINLNDIKNKKQIGRGNLFTFWDYLLSSLCWVFDLNFQESIDILNYYWYFEKIMEEFYKIEEISDRSINIIKENLLNFKIV